MFYSLSGKLVFSDTESVAIECGGVAYHCRVTLATAGSLGAIGATVKVYTYLSVRENAIDLFGFSTQVELRTFKMLIGVSSIGPKIAIGILSYLTPEQIALSIASNDYKSLTNAPGVGAKTAQRIVLELKDKISNTDVARGITDIPTITIGSGNINEAINALVALGYTQTQAATALAGTPSDSSVQDLIKVALKNISK